MTRVALQGRLPSVMTATPSAEVAQVPASVVTANARAAAWVGGLEDLLRRRPDLVGVHALADVTHESLKSSA